MDLNISPETAIPLTCLAYYLEMTENHSPNNLLKKTLTYFEHRILSGWNESIKALRSSEHVLPLAARLGLVDALLDSITSKAVLNPRFLGEPVKNSAIDDEDEQEERDYRPNAKRRLFVQERPSEDLTKLSLRLYEPVILAMIRSQEVPSEYIASSLIQYSEKWVFSSSPRAGEMSIYSTNSRREVIEAMERLFPNEIGLIPCNFLSEMLTFAIELEASSDCRIGYENRIGKQLDQASIKDLLIPSQGYAKEAKYDVDCVRRILKSFYRSYSRPDVSGLVKVAELVEGFLVEVAADVDLKISTFASLAEISASASVGIDRSSDGLYRAIDIYLDKHRYLTESEREEVCHALDCHKMSKKASEHAAQNSRLPMRVVVQVLFANQLQLRDKVEREVKESDERLRKLETEEGESEREEEEEVATVMGNYEEEMRVEMEKMGSKVMELEKECLEMRREIESGKGKKEKVSIWREMKRKFGCTSGSMYDYDNCHVKKKKVHPRQ
ncbi:hypothetical protein NMG60_11029319 [Bertholletia excelsa]